ncbi:hypothetical protein [Virgibacillus dokdonensis]|uniref:Uncharacterized protein n=1 Tax=Virgibacillus dokdonensis TaxID=302167 RepID=A0ABU7VB66_9BACI
MTIEKTREYEAYIAIVTRKGNETNEKSRLSRAPVKEILKVWGTNPNIFSNYFYFDPIITIKKSF